MSQTCRKVLRVKVKKTILWRVAILRGCFGSLWDEILACWIGKSLHYRQILDSGTTSAICHQFSSGEVTPCSSGGDQNKNASDLVTLKICLLGDSHIGKTSFLAKYVGKERTKVERQPAGINQVDKTLCVGGARISYSIWKVDGDASSLGAGNSKAPIRSACKDSVAMLFMFDLMSRCTLHSVISWYQQARKYNQTAIPVMVGTKFDDFIQLPIDLQWAIAYQARTYAKAINATLFFSSASYNINVNKIFKFITAKLFNLPWKLERNLTIGEPIIDF